MDPKSSTQLDPKLQEAYNRVMGVTVNTPGTPAATIPTSAPASAIPTDPAVNANPVPSTPNLEVTTPSAPQVSDNMPPMPAQEDKKEEKEEMVQTPGQPTVSMQSTVAAPSQSFVAKKGMKISPVILIVGGITFLLIYALIWIKIFNLPLPFLGQ